MIRVITIDSQNRFYDCDRVIELRNARIDYENKMVYYDGDWDCDMLWFEDIVKIEKQVKDLTLEEMIKIENLKLVMSYQNTLNSVLGISTKVGSSIEEIGFKSLYDYIDITHLIKGD